MENILTHKMQESNTIAMTPCSCCVRTDKIWVMDKMLATLLPLIHFRFECSFARLCLRLKIKVPFYFFFQMMFLMPCNFILTAPLQ